jgi:hypothetical protein
MLIIGGVVGGVVLLVILIFLAMPGKRPPERVKRKKGNNHAQMEKEARNLIDKGGLAREEFKKARDAGNKAEAMNKWQEASGYFNRARDIYNQLWNVYENRGHTGLERNIQDLNTIIKHHNSDMPIYLNR